MMWLIANRIIVPGLAKSSSQSGPIWSRRLCSRNWLPLMRTGSTFAWLHWSDTFTSDPPSESRRSSAFTEDTRTMVLPPPTSAPALDQLPAKWCRLWKPSSWLRKMLMVDAAWPLKDSVILTELPRKSNKPRPKYCLKRCGKVYHLWKNRLVAL